ncbi:MAG: YtxH domain-containing protein [Paludibacter sp.]|nr:YtxH domain-containing protein [Paludibacter sp.]
MSTGKVLLGVLAGAAVGVALGLLFAPEKGSVSRQQISRKGEDFWEDLRSKFEDLISSASEEINDAKNEAEDLYAEGKEKVGEVKNEMRK